MSDTKFWWVPLKEVTSEDQLLEVAAKEMVRATDLPSSFTVCSKLYGIGVRPGHLLALFDDDEVMALARVVALDNVGTLLWTRLPLLAGKVPTARPSLRLVSSDEALPFTLGIDALLRDTPPPAPRDVVATISPPAVTPVTATTPPSNIILYGPPGTGKTHCVRRRALKLLGLQFDDGDDLRISRTWEAFRNSGQVVFCTFHQAFAYEEFVEGLRAHTRDGTVHYEISAGIFKALALRAAAEGLETPTAPNELDLQTRWSLMLSALGSQPKIVKSRSGTEYALEGTPTQKLQAVKGTHNEEGVFVRDTSSTPLSISMNQFRPVWEVRASLGENPTTTQLSEIVNGFLSTAAYLAFRELLAITGAPPSRETGDPYERSRAAMIAGLPFDFSGPRKQFVLVIDEINRANMARVFGELMTLLESDKRLGADNELRLQLPVSKEWFGVPPNLHVIGTMNTADRSIALMDVALRRRFTFEEMRPDAKVLDKKLPDFTDRKLVVKVFEKLNERLGFIYDRDHQIGHAYFLGVSSLSKLREVFAEKVLPLLQEYFYGQWDKIALVLGYPLNADATPKEERNDEFPKGTFLTARKASEKSVLGFDHDDYVDQVAWDIHPGFRPRGTAPDDWLRQAFEELVGTKGG